MRARWHGRGVAADRRMVGILAATLVALPTVAAYIAFQAPEGIGTVFVALARVADRYLVDAEVTVPSVAANPTP